MHTGWQHKEWKCFTHWFGACDLRKVSQVILIAWKRLPPGLSRLYFYVREYNCTCVIIYLFNCLRISSYCFYICVCVLICYIVWICLTNVPTLQITKLRSRWEYLAVLGHHFGRKRHLQLRPKGAKHLPRFQRCQHIHCTWTEASTSVTKELDAAAEDHVHHALFRNPLAQKEGALLVPFLVEAVPGTVPANLLHVLVRDTTPKSMQVNTLRQSNMASWEIHYNMEVLMGNQL